MKFNGLFLGGIMALYSSVSFALPARQILKTVTQPDGSIIKMRTIGDEYLHLDVSEDGYVLKRNEKGFYYKEGKLDSLDFELQSERRKAPQTGIGMYTDNYPTEGSPRCMVILVEFEDIKFSEDYDVREYFEGMMNRDGFEMYGGTGSVNQYFKEQSGGKFTPEFDVYGPVTLPNSQAYYGDNRGQTWDCYAHYMVSHAAEMLDSTVDFSRYDEDGDGEIDFIYIFYAGQGEHYMGGPDTIWPHAGELKRVGNFKIVDGKWLNRYACSNELEGDIPAGMGPFIHEYSHILGLPDLYTTDMTVVDRDFTCGQYSVLDYGVYNNDSRTPPNFTAYERNALGWNEPVIFDTPVSVELQDLSTGTFGLIPTSRTEEFFLLENRQCSGWDSYLPGHGLLIWHIDYDKNKFTNNEVNKKREHQHVELIKANNEVGFIEFAAGFPYPGISGNNSFTAESIPSMFTWSGEQINLPVTDIIEDENGIIYFNIAGGGETLSVDTVISQRLVNDKVYYNILGQPIKNPVPGTIVIACDGEIYRKVIY